MIGYIVTILRAIFAPASLNGSRTSAPLSPVANFGDNPAFAGRERIATARTILTTALHNPNYEFRTIGALVKAVNSGLGEVMPDVWVEERLKEIPARQAYGKPHLWGAVDVVGAKPRRESYGY